MKNVEDIYALSALQRDILRETHQGTCAHRFNTVLHTELSDIRGPVFTEPWLERWNQAWSLIVRRHPVLRTLFVEGDGVEPQQVVLREVESSWSFRDLQGQRAHEQQRTVEDFVEAQLTQPFNLSRPPLIRAHLLATARETVHLVCAYHAAILDRQSAALMLSELIATHASLMKEQESRLPPAMPFREYIARIRSSRSERGFRYPALEGTVMSRRIDLPPVTARRLEEVCRAANVPVSAAIHAAWAMVLARRNGMPTPFGIEADVRTPGSDSLKPMLGPLTTIAPLRFQAGEDASTPDILRQVNEERETAHRNAHVPLSDMLEGAALTSAVRGPSPAFVLPEGLSVRSMKWRAVPPAPCSIELSSAPLSHVDLAFDPASIESSEAEKLASGLRAVVFSMASGARDGRSLLVNDPPSISASGGIDLGTIARMIERHERVRAARVWLETDERGVSRIAASVEPAVREPRRPIQFSVFNFAQATVGNSDDKYHLYLETARYADRQGFAAVWTPERHFHDNGGLYPNPSVLSAALATTTEQIRLRAGSVVLPLHHTLRVAEEWSIVDNLSRGRVGVSFASGWVPNDFAFFPERFSEKRAHMFRQIEELQRLWRGEKIPARDGVGNDYEVGIFPRPIQASLPIWITCTGDPAVVEKAADSRHAILTSFITMGLEEVSRLIALYRRRILEASGGADRGHVTLMIHAYVGEEETATRELVRPALSRFLGSHVGLVRSVRDSTHLAMESEQEQQLVSFAFEKYYRAGSLIGTFEKCAAMVERLSRAGVDELACQVDFGLDAATVLEGMHRLTELKNHFDRERSSQAEGELSVAELQRYLAGCLPASAVPANIRLTNALSPTGSTEARAD